MNNIIGFFKKHSLAIFIIVTFVFGCVGGLAGGILARAYLDVPLNSLLPFGNLDFSAGRYAGQGLVISNAKNVIVQQDAKIDETINSVGLSLVGIYKKELAPPKLNDVFAPENFYKINSPSGQGFVITSDGWIVTSMVLLKNYNDYVVITQDKKIYQIDYAVDDRLTKFNFIHVQARDLTVRKLAEIQEIKKGSLVIVVNWLGLNLVSSMSGLGDSGGLVKSSDNFSKKIVLNNRPSSDFKGSAIFNLAGDALGLVNNVGEIEPIGHLNGAIKSLFKNKASARPSLGINYIDLTELAEVSGQNSRWQKGAVIYNDQKASAIKKNSPAERSGLRQGDVIISLNGLELDKDNDLAEVIHNYLAGETISLLILRQGEEREVKVTLDKLD